MHDGRGEQRLLFGKIAFLECDNFSVQPSTKSLIWTSSLAADGLDLPLPELHTDGLDAEQVWMQIEMQLEPLLGKAKGALRRLRPAISAGDELTAERLLRLPANAQGEASGSDEEAPEWEPFEDGVEYDMDGEERDEEGEEHDDEEEEEEEEDPGGSPGKRKDLTSKLFENPGMFNLTEMENFALQAEAEEEARLEREAVSYTHLTLPTILLV